MFRNGVSEWMVQSRNGCVSGSVSGKSLSEMVKCGCVSGWCSARCFGTVFRNMDGLDGSVNGVSERCFQTWMVWMVQCISVFRYFGALVFRCFGISIFSVPIGLVVCIEELPLDMVLYEHR